MRTSRGWSALALGLGIATVGGPAIAQSPGLYYAWRSIDKDLVACIDRSTAALTNQGLGSIQVAGNSVAGSTDDATVVFVCLENPDDITVMIMVSSTDDDAAFNLRETLKVSF